MENNLTVKACFPSTVYIIDKPEFLNEVAPIVDEYINNTKLSGNCSELNPIYESKTMHQDLRLVLFSEYILDTALSILRKQGYNVNGKLTRFDLMWSQHYEKTGGMEQHIHSNNVQLVGFYFVDCPQNVSRLVLYDPRAGKKQINLPEASFNDSNSASDMVLFEPKQGMMMFINSWLPHSFTRHGSEKPFKFIHFNICVDQNISTPLQAQAATQHRRIKCPVL